MAIKLCSAGKHGFFYLTHETVGEFPTATYLKLDCLLHEVAVRAPELLIQNRLPGNLSFYN